MAVTLLPIKSFDTDTHCRCVLVNSNAEAVQKALSEE
jgi:hypothetical protein